MSDNDKFNECLECSGCSGDCGQGCGSCPENKPALEAEGSLDAAVELNIETSSEAGTSDKCKEVEINPMDLDEVAEKTEDLGPKVDPSRGKLDCFNYLADIPGGKADYDIVEVQFKNTRKGFYRNTSNLDLKLGDMVAVESQPGHDIGRVTLVGHLVRNQMRKAGLNEDSEIRKIFRFARPADMEKYYEAKALEIPTMIGSRQIAAELGLKMKIGDVEYQGDGLKAIFYYIADERVDFRQLIKILAERFKIRVEMRQIGARQEAGRIGGIGPCGRPLCCSTWMTNFVTVATSAARHQDLSLNPQKLAGQCAKLKCCLNFEIDTYLESVKKMPPKETRLETLEASWYHFKTDIFKGEITYSSDKKNAVNTITITAERAFEIIEMNSRGEKPASLIPDDEAKTKAQGSYNDILGDDSQIGRFDKKKKKKKKKKDKEAGGAASGADSSANDTVETAEEESVEDVAIENENAPAPTSKVKEQPKSKKKDREKESVSSKPQVPTRESSEVEPTEQNEAQNPGEEAQSSTANLKTENAATPETDDKVVAEDGEMSRQLPQSQTQEHEQTATDAPKDNADVESSSLQNHGGDNKEKSATEAPVQEAVLTTDKPQGTTSEAAASSQSETESGSETLSEVSLQKEETPEDLSEDVDNTSSSTGEKRESANGEALETGAEHKHHNNQGHHNHRNQEHHTQEQPNQDYSGKDVSSENGGELPEAKDQPRKGNNPNKGQWQGKNQGKVFKPQQGKGQDKPNNREPGKTFKQQQGKGTEQAQGAKGQNPHPQHQHNQQHGQPQHGQPQHGQQKGQQPHPQGQQPQQGPAKEQNKHKGQNPSQDSRVNKENQGKVFKPQRQGNPLESQQPHQGQGAPSQRDEFQNQGGFNNKKKNKKPYPVGDNAANPNQPSNHGEQGRGHNQGHHNANRPPQGPRPNQNPKAANQNPTGGNGE